MKSFDVAIIGAGPAGSAAAIHLARRGCRTVLIESRPFPRIKVCGEFISPAATTHLESILPRAELIRLGARTVDSLSLQRGTRSIRWNMPHSSRARAWVLSRASLDTALASAASDAGVELMQPATLRAARYENHAVTLDLDHESIRASIIIHADGHGRHDAPAAHPTPMRPGVLGHKCHLRLPPDQSIHGLTMRSAKDAYIGMVTVEAGLTTIALVASQSCIAAHRANADAMLQSLCPDYNPAWRASDWLTCGIARSHYINPGHPRSFRIGNAAAAVEPVGGEGIGLALWSASTLSDHLPPDLTDLSALRAAHICFARAYRSRLRFRRPSCDLAAWVLMRPAIVAALWPLLSIPLARYAILAPWYALTGKPIAQG